MSKFTENLSLAEIGAPPKSATQLLTQLGVREQPKAAQRDAVAAWLQDHEPVPVLRMGLEYWGLLPDGVSRNGHSAER